MLQWEAQARCRAASVTPLALGSGRTRPKACSRAHICVINHHSCLNKCPATYEHSTRYTIRFVIFFRTDYNTAAKSAMTTSYLFDVALLGGFDPKDSS